MGGPSRRAYSNNRPMAEYRGFDPDRNPFDISQDKGFEVDVGRWLHG